MCHARQPSWHVNHDPGQAAGVLVYLPKTSFAVCVCVQELGRKRVFPARRYSSQEFSRTWPQIALFQVRVVPGAVVLVQCAEVVVAAAVDAARKLAAAASEGVFVDFSWPWWFQ